MQKPSKVKGFSGRVRAGDGVYTSVAIADISAAAVAALTEPEKHVRQTYTLTGESVTEKQVGRDDQQDNWQAGDTCEPESGRV
jgi:uncharacterized protein YbjT (DUF2867 family)